jgi:DNA-binding PadR family transcriptional regulator
MPPRQSSLGLIVLAMLVEEPMHAYRMQKLLERRGKDRVVNVRQRASLYQAIDRLLRLGLVGVRETVRGDGSPDRVVYEITDEGRETARVWLREILRTTGGDFPAFPAGVSVLTLLAPEDACRQLEARADAIGAQLADTDAAIALAGELPRVFLLEEEYRRAVLSAELDWLGRVVDELRTGRLTWDADWLREMTERFSDSQGSPTDGAA